MSDRLSRTDARLGAIEHALADVHRRIAALELSDGRSPAVLRGALAPAIAEPPLPLLTVRSKAFL